MDTVITAGAAFTLARMSAVLTGGPARMSSGGYPVMGGRLVQRQEKTGSVLETAGGRAAGRTSTAHTTDLRGIPPRGPAPV